MKKRIISALLVAVAFFALYSAIILFETNIFPGNTTINGKSFSYRDNEYIVKSLNESTQYHDIKILNGEEELATLNTKDCLKVEYSPEKINELLEDISPIERVFFFLYKFDYNIKPEISIIDEKFDEVMVNIDSGDIPQNAYIKYDKKDEQFVIVPHTNGNQVDKEAAINMIKEAALNGNDSIDISDAFVKAGILEDNENLKEQLDKLNKDFSYSIKYTIGQESTKSFIELKGAKLMNLYERDEFGIPYISSDGDYEVDEKAAKKFLDSMTLSSSEKDIVTAQAGAEENIEAEEDAGMSTKKNIDKDKELEWLCKTLTELKDASRKIQ